LDKRLERIFEEVRLDSVSGASAIVGSVCERVLEVVTSKSPPTPADLRGFAVGLVTAQPNMAPMWNLANSILHAGADATELRKTLKATAEHHRKAHELIGRGTAKVLAGKTVVTNSSSRAVLSALTFAARISKPVVRVAESRPQREGLLLADQLSMLGIPVEVFADAALGSATVGADVALAGVDAITDKSVIAKIGFSHLMLSAREVGLSRVILGDSTKFAPIHFSEDPRDPLEVVEESCRGITVINRYFEETSLDIVDMVITESAKLRPEEAAAKASKIRLAPELRALRLT